MHTPLRLRRRGVIRELLMRYSLKSDGRGIGIPDRVSPTHLSIFFFASTRFLLPTSTGLYRVSHHRPITHALRSPAHSSCHSSHTRRARAPSSPYGGAISPSRYLPPHDHARLPFISMLMSCTVFVFLVLMYLTSILHLRSPLLLSSDSWIPVLIVPIFRAL
jgi:hypothetical protein